MATLTVNKPDLSAAGITPVTATPSASDSFSAAGSDRYLITITGPTSNGGTLKIDDPNTQPPAAATAFDPDASCTVVQAVKKQWLIRSAARYKDANNNINLTFTGVVTGAIIEITEV